MEVGDVTVLFLFYIRTKNTSYNRRIKFKGGLEMVNILVKIGTLFITLLLTPLMIAGKVTEWAMNFYSVLWNFIKKK